ncbi:MAG: hypothetical protein K2M52_01205, partial [Paramuribaculum sp.]|nr:hypothetical protein [Paramuribaculum sp.]
RMRNHFAYACNPKISEYAILAFFQVVASSQIYPLTSAGFLSGCVFGCKVTLFLFNLTNKI